MKPIFIVVGPSGSGKSTLCKKTGMREAVSHTTRSIRPGEVDGRDYYFITQDEFHAMEGDLLEKVEYSGNFYGLSKEEYWKSDIVVAEPEGVRTICAQSCIFGRPAYVIGIACKQDICEQRMLKRGDNPVKVAERMLGDSVVFNNLDEYCDIVINGASPDCFEKMRDFINCHGGDCK